MGLAARAVVVVLTLAGLGGLGGQVAACGGAGNALTNAAAKDPMRCEQNPDCAKGRSSYVDCTRQCVDDYECMQRCQQVQQGIDAPPGGQGR
jgi:hypothetical protein